MKTSKRIVLITGIGTFAFATAGCPSINVDDDDIISNPPPAHTGLEGDTGQTAISNPRPAHTAHLGFAAEVPPSDNEADETSGDAR